MKKPVIFTITLLGISVLYIQSIGAYAIENNTKTEESNLDDGNTAFAVKEDASILDYLNPTLFGSNSSSNILDEISLSLRKGNLVVIKNAFVPEFAEHTWGLMDSHDEWQQFPEVKEDGYTSFRHIPLNQDKERFRDVVNVFEHPKTKEFISNLSKRDVYGNVVTYPTLFRSGDFQNPHNDRYGSRSVTMLWQLTKDWKAKWGGAFYWASTAIENAYHHPSFNTLILFSVTARSIHSVTPISNESKGKRLTFMTWFHADHKNGRDISLNSAIEEWFVTDGKQPQHLTLMEEHKIRSLDIASVQDEQRKQRLEKMRDTIVLESMNAGIDEKVFYVDIDKEVSS